jgi:hypothetical protein
VIYIEEVGSIDPLGLWRFHRVHLNTSHVLSMDTVIP